MSQRVNLYSEVKRERSRRETESDKGELVVRIRPETG